MADVSTIYIIFSTELYRNVSAHIKEIDEGIDLDIARLYVFKEPTEMKDDLWETYLEPKIVQTFKRYENTDSIQKLRIAAHTTTCFLINSRKDDRYDLGFPENEQKLKKMPGCEKISDIQVWGYHHDTRYSKIWKILETISNVLNASVKEKQDYVQELETMFDAIKTEEKKVDTVEFFSVKKHTIVGLFTPLSIKLQTAEVVPDKEKSKKQEVRDALPAKLELAESILVGCEEKISSEAVKGFLIQVKKTLLGAKKFTEENGQLESAVFSAWLLRLDSKLEDLKNLAINE